MKYAELVANATEIKKVKNIGGKNDSADVGIRKHADGFGIIFRNRSAIKKLKSDACRVLVAGDYIYFVPSNKVEGFSICFKARGTCNGYLKFRGDYGDLTKFIGDYDLELDKDCNMYYIDLSGKM